MFSEGDGFEPEIVEAQQGADANLSHSCSCEAVRGVEPVVVIGFWACGVKVSVNFSIVGFLIQGDGLDARTEKLLVFAERKRVNFDGD